MDPLLPSEVALLVLRYLATNDCTKSMGAFLIEMSCLKDTFKKIPTKLDLPPVFGSLTEILNDYGRSKLFVRNLVTKLLMDWKAIPEDSISPCDTLITQLRQINLLLTKLCGDAKENSAAVVAVTVAASQNKKTKSTSKYVQTTSTVVDASVTSIIRTKRIASTCTADDNVIEGCWSTCACLHVHSKIPSKVYVEVETQTEFLTHMEKENIDMDVLDVNVETERLETIEEKEKNVVFALIHNVLDETNQSHDTLLGLANSVLQKRSISDTPEKKEMALQAVFSEADCEVDNFLRDLLCGENMDLDLEDGELCDEPEPDAPPGSVDEFKMAEQNLISFFPVSGPGPDADNRIETTGPGALVNNDMESNIEIINQKNNKSQVHPGCSREEKCLDDTVTAQLPIPETLDKIDILNQTTITAPLPLVIETNNILPKTSAWQRLGRRTIVPKIPLTLAPIAKPIIVEALDQPNLNPVPVLSKSGVNVIRSTAMPKPILSSTLQAVQSQNPAVKVKPTNDNKNKLTATANHKPTKLITGTGSPIKLITGTGVSSTKLLTGTGVSPTPLITRTGTSPLLKRLITIAQTIPIPIPTPGSNTVPTIPSPVTQVRLKPERKSYSTPRKKHVRNIQFLTPPNLKNKSPEKNETPVRQLAQDSTSLLKKGHIQKTLFPPVAVAKAALKEITKIQDISSTVARQKKMCVSPGLMIEHNQEHTEVRNISSSTRRPKTSLLSAVSKVVHIQENSKTSNISATDPLPTKSLLPPVSKVAYIQENSKIPNISTTNPLPTNSLLPPDSKVVPSEQISEIQNTSLATAKPNKAQAAPPSSIAKMPEAGQQQNLPVRAKPQRKRKIPEKHISRLNHNNEPTATAATASFTPNEITAQEILAATQLSTHMQSFRGDSDGTPLTPRYQPGLDSDWDSPPRLPPNSLAYFLPTQSRDDLPVTPGKNLDLDILPTRRHSPVGERKEKEKEVIRSKTSEFESKPVPVVSFNNSNAKNVSKLNVPFYVAGRAKNLTTIEHETINGLFRLKEGVGVGSSSPVSANMFTPRSSPIRELPESTFLETRALTDMNLDHFPSTVHGDSKKTFCAKKMKLNHSTESAISQ